MTNIQQATLQRLHSYVAHHLAVSPAHAHLEGNGVRFVYPAPTVAGAAEDTITVDAEGCVCDDGLEYGSFESWRDINFPGV